MEPLAAPRHGECLRSRMHVLRTTEWPGVRVRSIHHPTPTTRARNAGPRARAGLAGWASSDRPVASPPRPRSRNAPLRFSLGVRYRLPPNRTRTARVETHPGDEAGRDRGVDAADGALRQPAGRIPAPPQTGNAAHSRQHRERAEIEDSVVDVCIALEALFVDTKNEQQKRMLISRRGSWYFADSQAERDRTRDLLKEFYDLRSEIVHGDPPAAQTAREEAGAARQRRELTAKVLDLARASLKDMIDEGRPNDWKQSKQRASVRRNPPRTDSQIPSIKSDSLSWSLAEQKDIDRRLESVWRPAVDAAQPLSPGDGATNYGNFDPKSLAECRERGIECVVIHPARLYMAHPKWPKTASEPLDERVRYYCRMDVERHLALWRQAATAKRLTQFLVVHADSAVYHPSRRATWPLPLQ